MQDLREKKIYVAGHEGLVGSAIVRALKARGFENIVGKAHKELDLMDATAVDAFFSTERPDIVFLAAAKVGGIAANNTFPVEFLRSNLLVELNVMESAHKYEVEKLLFLGSSCIYPKLAPQPIPESALMTGPLEATNSAYAIAKIAGIELGNAYRKQFGMNIISVMPTNLYGPGDNFHAEHAHVLPMLLKRFHEAKVQGASSVAVWGTGSPRREFLHVDDLARACVFLMEQYDEDTIVNIGTGEDVSIKELAELIKTTVEYTGEITWDATRPDGTPRKLLDVSRIHALGWKHETKLVDGLKETYTWFKENQNNLRT